ncbi:IS21-like element helper ATPase IstB [Acetivibrio clariflavus]|uniref:DNA replication protein n=1 Tax=Acetivibrio clariflavus (strain DSM 19732 / NBRC 101661 / EBR45) TaxID=720554 RepID=G8LU15_ACECE|nr:IS21-like element helper ATPase IstB [Acetivibrio clariflavus]AEV68403.1 DNA replication protein [Acetivibrio clariflavus DSM 19732]AEV68945.1 DNA replication protein [Acetivibrio clariflavus DSM 19732]
MQQSKIDNIETMLKTVNLHHIAVQIKDIFNQAINESISYEKFLEELLKCEIKGREEKRFERRLKHAEFPEYKTLDEFDLKEQTTLSKKQFNQLRELSWIEQGYNLILLGPTGVGKTFLSIGLGVEAINCGYKVHFITMHDLIHILKTQEILRTSRTRYQRIVDSDLVIIDDLMFIAMEKHEANLFFQLINKLYGQSSIIITSNKGPEDWGELLGAPAITTAILDRIVHKCQVLNLDGESYRLKHRQTIFGNN